MGKSIRIGLPVFLDLGELRLECALGRLLDVEIEGGEDPEPGLVELGPEPRLELLADVLDEIVADPGVVGPGRERQRIGLPRLGRLVGELALDRKSTRLNSSHLRLSRMPSSA